MKPPRPRIRPRLDGYDYFMIVGSILIALSHGVYLGMNPLPSGSHVPLKFDFSGSPTAYGDPRSLWLFFWLTLVMIIPVNILAFFPWLHNFPWVVTEKNAYALYRLSQKMCFFISFWLSLLLLVCNVLIIKIAQMPNLLFPGVMVLILGLGPVVSTVLFFIRGSRISKS